MRPEDLAECSEWRTAGSCGLAGRRVKDGAGQLLDEERDAVGPRQQLRRARPAAPIARSDQCIEQLDALARRQRVEIEARERSRRRPTAGRSPAGTSSSNEQRHVAGALEQPTEKVDRRRIGPVQVLHHHDARAAARLRTRQIAQQFSVRNRRTGGVSSGVRSLSNVPGDTISLMRFEASTRSDSSSRLQLICREAGVDAGADLIGVMPRAPSPDGVPGLR